MNRFFRKLPLAAKLLLIALVPLILLQYLAFQVYRQEKENVELLQSYIQRVRQSAHINQLIDALQNERKYSFDYAMKKTDKQFLLNQRPKTDSVIGLLEKSTDYAITGFRNYTFLRRLPEIRAAIDTGHLPADVVMSYYSNAIFRLSYIYNIPSVNNSYLQPTYEELVDQKILSQMVTFLGVIRSNFYNVLYTKQNGMGTLYGLAGIYEVYKTYETEFLQKASPELLKRYQYVRNNTPLKSTIDYIDTRFAKMSFDSTYTPEEWWQLSDVGINELQALQQNLRRTIEADLVSVSKNELTKERLVILLLIFSLLIVTGVVAYTVWVLTKTLKELKVAARKISAGKKIKPFENLPADVIGALADCILQIAQTNEMLAAAANEIGKGKFDVEINPRSPDDILGNAIVKMKLELQHFTRELQESKESFKQLADVMPQIVWTARPDGTVDYYNKRWYEYTGLNENDGEQAWTSILHPNDLQFCRDTWDNSVKTGESFSIEYRFKDRKSGGYRWFLGKAIPVKNETGNIVKWFGTCTDIQDQKMFAQELEQKVQERTKDLERSNNDLEQFAYIASHDLQEPIRKISTFADLIKQNGHDAFSDNANMYLDKIVSSADRMRTIIKDLLDFSHLNNPRELFTQVDLNKILESVKTDLELLIQQKDAIITSIPLPEIEAIPVQMNQLFYNLINNALKFSHPERKPTIEISLMPVNSRDPQYNKGYDEYFQITVKDNGIGFEQLFAERIFVMFQQLNEKKMYGGTGIGLALCKKIVENHKGQITASSQPGEGAVFTILLPRSQNLKGLNYQYNTAKNSF